MNIKNILLSFALIITSCTDSTESEVNDDDAEASPSTAEDVSSVPAKPTLPPDISTKVIEVSDEADCGLTHRSWGDMKRSLVKGAELEYKNPSEIEADLYDLPYGGYCSLRIPRISRSSLRSEFFPIVILDRHGKVVYRPTLSRLDISFNDYGGA